MLLREQGLSTAKFERLPPLKHLFTHIHFSLLFLNCPCFVCLLSCCLHLILCLSPSLWAPLNIACCLSLSSHIFYIAHTSRGARRNHKLDIIIIIIIAIDTYVNIFVCTYVNLCVEVKQTNIIFMATLIFKFHTYATLWLSFLLL